MKILFLTSKPIFPLVDGGCRASQNFLQLLLSGGHNVKYITISTPKHTFQIEEFPEEFRKRLQPDHVLIDTSLKVIDALISLIKGTSYNYERFNDQKWSDLVLNEINSNDYDVIIFDGLYSTGSFEQIRPKFNGKIFLRAHNVEYKIWSQLSEHTGNPLKKRYYSKLSGLLKKEEQRLYSSMDGIISITSIDEKIFNTEFDPKQTITIPYTQPEVKAKNTYTSADIFHLGSMNWEPNIEAVRVLTSEIFPKIRESLPTVSLKIAGSHMNIKEFDDPHNGIKAIGFIEDLETWYQTEGIFVSPIQSGSGVRIKILEAMNHGIPVITTKAGALGISEEGQMIIADSNEEIIEKAIALASDKSLRRELGHKAAQFIRDHYSVAQTSNRLNTFLNDR